MNEFSPDINTTVIKLKTDKPVRKTPYQVKGVFIKKATLSSTMGAGVEIDLSSLVF